MPIVGGLILGAMARFGSERIRGHGIPEALEAIMMGGSRLGPRVAVLKPISSAISIGSGGPFGAEGPIIMTGGAAGSLIAQFFHFTSSERKTLMVAGAAAGMAAVFAAPIAALALAVELLLFEFKPRSLFPVAVAAAIAATVRRPLLGDGPIFPVPAHHIEFGGTALFYCVLAGIAAGLLALAITRMVYAAEDAFAMLPIHWMWWPAIGGIAIGIGGLIFPEALGVGYDVIAQLLTGEAPMRIIVGVLLVKSVIWAIPLGAGTSGGVLAPMLMMGAALGALEGHIFPDYGPGFWAIVGMAAILGGTMRVPFTALLFTIELTQDVGMLLPLLVATVVAYGVTVLAMPRSILTEKISRRGFHITREYSVDPLEVLSVQEVMRTRIVALPVDLAVPALESIAAGTDQQRGQHLYPVLDADGELASVVTRRELRARLQDPAFRSSPNRCRRWSGSPRSWPTRRKRFVGWRPGWRKPGSPAFRWWSAARPATCSAWLGCQTCCAPASASSPTSGTGSAGCGFACSGASRAPRPRPPTDPQPRSSPLCDSRPPRLHGIGHQLD